MKKLILGAALLCSILSCSKEEEKDCNCNRVVEASYPEFNIVNSSGGISHVIMGGCTTVNDCTGKKKTFSYQNYGKYAVGNCGPRY